MSGASAKASRRQIRRAFGADSMQAIERQDRELDELREQIKEALRLMQARIHQLEVQLDERRAISA